LRQAQVSFKRIQIIPGIKSEMRHVISVLLQNEVGALTRMTGLFSSRGYNIESLNVAPTDDSTISRVTLVISGSDAAIAQLNTQLAKLVDVVNIHDMTIGEHFERELVIVKLKLRVDGYGKVQSLAKKFGAEILDDSPQSCTVQLTGSLPDIDKFIQAVEEAGELAAVARSGSVAVSKGEVTLSSYTQHHRLTG
jgi:acetolactate synthase-1/3 small subunit